jgi:hypothetical protein
MSAADLVTGARARVQARIPAERAGRIALAVLLGLVAAGVALRLGLMLAQRPAFIGFPDSGTYINNARGDLWGDPLRPVGYPLFLRLLHAISAKLSITILVQHALGVGSALLLYGAVRRAGFPRPAALVPAAVVLLSGSQAFLEHAPLSETLFTFLIACSVYAAARLVEHSSAVWAAAAGLLVGLSVTVRVAGLVLAPVLALWIAFGAGAAVKRRLMHAAAALAASAVVLGGYVIAQHEATGFTGFTRAGAWNLYGRVAPFADCSKFTPPEGTRRVCEHTPRSGRPPPGAYVLETDYSPGMKHLRGPFLATSADNRKIAAFTRSVIVAQPWDYVSAVAKGMLEYADPAGSSRHEGPNYDEFFHKLLFDPLWSSRVKTFALGWYGAAGQGLYVKQGRVDALLRYESATQVKGPLFIMLALLSLLSPLLSRGRRRSAALLFVLVTWVTLITPVATLWWSARYAVPGFGPLAASAAIGGWALWCRLQALRRERTRPQLARAGSG